MNLPAPFRQALSLLALFWCAAALAAGPARFDEANRFYEQGKYAEALAAYGVVLQAGQVSPALLFNTGNAHFKNGELGRAILRYRQAGQLAPRDPDIQANLGFARDQVQGTASIQPSPLARALGYFTANELSAAAAILFWGWLLLLGAGLFRPALRSSLRPAVCTAGSLLAAAAILLALSLGQARSKTAIVIEKQAPVRLGPLDESQISFSAPDGAELRVAELRGEWAQVADRSGRTGWIRLRQIEIFPSSSSTSFAPSAKPGGGA